MRLQLLAWGLRHRRWRHAINVVSMVLTVSVVVMFVSVMTGILHFVHDTGTAGGKFSRIIILKKVGGGGLPEALLPTIQAIDGVQVAQRFHVIGGRLPNGITYFVVGED